MLTKGSNSNLIEGFGIKNSGLHINHLQFYGDTILLSTTNREKLTRLFEIIQSFEQISGLHISHSKSKFMSINLDNSIVKYLVDAFGCKVRSWSSTYLRLPLNGKPFSSIMIKEELTPSNGKKFNSLFLKGVSV